MPELAPVVFLQQADSAFLETARGYAERMWSPLARLFVGEDLLIQLCALAGVFFLSYLVSLGMRPLIEKSAVVAGGRSPMLAGAAVWLRTNLFRLLLATLLWSVSIAFDGYHRAQADRLERASLEARARAAAEATQLQSARRAADGRMEIAQRAANAPAAREAAVDEETESKNYILLRAVASVATLVLVGGALPQAVRRKPYYKTLFFVLAVGLMLNLLGVWGIIRDGLNSLLLLPLSGGGETRVTALTLLKGVIAILVVIPATGWALRFSETRIEHLDTVSPALRALVSKFAKTLIIVAAALFAISAIGIDLSAFAMFGGAIGLGLGFGFQKVVSNLISGVILLGDRSIKPGDVIQVDETYGWINRLGARYVSVITRDGTEHLIPNETLITEKVVNWSFSDDKVRVKAPFGVAYTSNIHLAMELAQRAASETPRVLASPEPSVRLMGFGDNSVNFELRFWISDPSKGVINVRSEIFTRIWDLFHEQGVEFPYPQRDLYLKSAPTLEVRVRPAAASEDA